MSAGWRDDLSHQLTGLADAWTPEAAWQGDLDGMLKRRLVRVLTVQNPILYFVDRGREVGITYELVKQFEQELNKKLGSKVVTVHVIAIPVPRDGSPSGPKRMIWAR